MMIAFLPIPGNRFALGKGERRHPGTPILVPIAPHVSGFQPGREKLLHLRHRDCPHTPKRNGNRAQPGKLRPPFTNFPAEG